MARYILTFEIDDAFYQEFREDGATPDALLEQLRLDLEDQLDEYDLQQLLPDIVSAHKQQNLVILVPKKERDHLLSLS